MQTFKKNERLCSKTAINKLFTKGASFFVFPFKVNWTKVENEDSPVKVIIAVPKRSFKSAVERNRIKRLMREAYRKNKETLYQYLQQKDRNIHLSLIYTSNKKLKYQEIEKKIIAILDRLIKENEKGIS